MIKCLTLLMSPFHVADKVWSCKVTYAINNAVWSEIVSVQCSTVITNTSWHKPDHFMPQARNKSKKHDNIFAVLESSLCLCIHTGRKDHISDELMRILQILQKTISSSFSNLYNPESQEHLYCSFYNQDNNKKSDKHLTCGW